MSLVKKFLDSQSGNWLSPSQTTEGDTVEVKAVALDTSTIDDKERTSLVVTGIHRPVENPGQSQEVKVRLGVKNVARIAKALGEDEKRWIGNYIEAMSIEMYQSFGKAGVLWRGVMKNP